MVASSSFVSGLTPWQFALLWLYGGMSVLAFLVFAYDKLIAGGKCRGGKRRRIPEVRLYLLAFCGGWPGAWLAMALLRHKTSKTAFLWRFHLAQGANLALLGLFLAKPLLGFDAVDFLRAHF